MGERDKTARQFPEVGRFVRHARESRGLTARDVAARASMREAQMSYLQNGGDALWHYYDDAARAIGYRSALEMFTSGGDDQTAQLLRLWRSLPDDAARKDVLRTVKAMRDAAEAAIAT